MSRAQQERKRLRAPVDRTDPQAITAWAHDMRPIVANIRGLAEEATLPPTHRRYTRVFLRRRILRAILDLDARLDAVAIPVQQASVSGD